MTLRPGALDFSNNQVTISRARDIFWDLNRLPFRRELPRGEPSKSGESITRDPKEPRQTRKMKHGRRPTELGAASLKGW
jgi:hypothetical protein